MRQRRREDIIQNNRSSSSPRRVEPLPFDFDSPANALPKALPRPAYGSGPPPFGRKASPASPSSEPTSPPPSASMPPPSSSPSGSTSRLCVTRGPDMLSDTVSLRAGRVGTDGAETSGTGSVDRAGGIRGPEMETTEGGSCSGTGLTIEARDFSLSAGLSTRPFAFALRMNV